MDAPSQVLRERQLQPRQEQALQHSHAPVKASSAPHLQAGGGGGSTAVTDAFAKLQAQRLKRAELRLTTSAAPSGLQGSLQGIHSQGSASSHNHPQQHATSNRIRSKLTTTAGSGMQRQAPSRCNSACSSVRGSVDYQQQQMLLLGAAVPPAASTAPATHCGSFAAKAATTASNSLCRHRPLRSSSGGGGGWGCGAHHPVRSDSHIAPLVPSTQHGLREALQVEGTALSVLQQQQQQQPGPTKPSPAAITPHASSGFQSSWQRQACQQSAGMFAVQATAAAAADGSSHLMGCGISWHQLSAAVCAAVASASQQAVPALRRKQQQQHQQHRLLVAQLVVQQWTWFCCSRRKLRAAVRQRSLRLMAAGWQGLSHEVAEARLLACRANLQATKAAFMLLSRSFTAWQQLMELRRRLDTVSDTLQAYHHRQLLKAALTAWRDHAQHKRRQRQLLLRAEACFMLMTLLRVLQHWRTWLTDRKLHRLRVARADQHWQQVVQRHVWACWQQRVAEGAAKWQLLAQALCFHTHTLCSKAVKAWRQVIPQQQAARAAAVAALERCREQQELSTAQCALQVWLQVAEIQADQRQLVAELQAKQQQRLRQQVLVHWSQLVRYHHQLCVAAEALHLVEPRWWLQHSLMRWQRVAAALAGQRSAELRELVLLRACIGQPPPSAAEVMLQPVKDSSDGMSLVKGFRRTWLQYTDVKRRVSVQLTTAIGSLQRSKLCRLLSAWAHVTADLQEKHALQQRAQQHYQKQLKWRLLLLWQGNAAESGLERLQVEAAAELRRQRLLHAGLQGLAWYCRHRVFKAAAPLRYSHALQHRTLTAWRQVLADKQQSEQHTRLAVRHNQLNTLDRGLRAWAAAVQHARHKQQRRAAAEEHHEAQLLRCSFKAWRGPFMQQQHQKHCQLDAADRHVAAQLLRRSLRAWRAACAAHRAKAVQQAVATSCYRYKLLRKGLLGLKELHQETLKERRELAAAAGPALKVLARLRRQQVLAAWRGLVQEQQWQRAAMEMAAEHVRHTLLHNSLVSWQHYLHLRRHKASAAQSARDHRCLVLLAAGLSSLRSNVAAAVRKRRRVFAAAMHRRSWLIWRAFKAWRLAAAAAHLESSLPVGPAALHPVLGNLRGSSQHSSPSPQQLQQLQQPQQQQQQHSLGSVAAAVVEASCASHLEWQQQWRLRCEQLLQQQQALQLMHQPPPPTSQQQQQLLQDQEDHEAQEAQHVLGDSVDDPTPVSSTSTAQASQVHDQQQQGQQPHLLQQQQQRQAAGSASMLGNAPAVGDEAPAAEGNAPSSAGSQPLVSRSAAVPAHSPLTAAAATTGSCKQAGRRPPRLPSFMQNPLYQAQQQHQQWQPLDQQLLVSSDQYVLYQQQQQQPSSSSCPGDNFGAVLGTQPICCNLPQLPQLPHQSQLLLLHEHAGLHKAAKPAWLHESQPTTPVQQQLLPEAPVTAACLDAVAAAGVREVQLSWHTPQVGRKGRLLPRQLKPANLDSPIRHTSSWNQQQRQVAQGPSISSPHTLHQQQQQQQLLLLPQQQQQQQQTTEMSAAAGLMSRSTAVVSLPASTLQQGRASIGMTGQQEQQQQQQHDAAAEASMLASASIARSSADVPSSLSAVGLETALYNSNNQGEQQQEQQQPQQQQDLQLRPP